MVFNANYDLSHARLHRTICYDEEKNNCYDTTWQKKFATLSPNSLNEYKF